MSKALDSVQRQRCLCLYCSLTRVRGVVEGIAHDFEGTAEVEETHGVVEGEEDLDWVCGIAALSNCTHLDCDCL